jgi:hypothetical protein
VDGRLLAAGEGPELSPGGRERLGLRAAAPAPQPGDPGPRAGRQPDDLDQSEHLSIAFDPVAAYTILNALAPRHPRPVPCVPVLPFVGAVGYSD